MRKIIKLMVFMLIAFILTKNAYAKTITATELSEEFNNSDIVKSFEELGNNTSSTVDEENKKIDIYSDEEKVFSFDYGNDYIMYEDLDTIITRENCDNGFVSMIYIGTMIETMLKLSGYENKTIKDDYPATGKYNEYGLEMETERFEFGDENSGVSGDYIRKFKMSLDTDKIDALMEEYGQDVEKEDEDNQKFATLTPTLEANEITENSVTLSIELGDVELDSEDTVFCSIYQTDKKDGEYEEIQNGMKFNCTETVKVTVDELDSGKTYYYKAKVDGGLAFSNVVTVTTKSLKKEVSTTGNKDIDKNPDTGSHMVGTMIVGLLLFSFAFSYYFFRKAKTNGISI